MSKSRLPDSKKGDVGDLVESGWRYESPLLLKQVRIEVPLSQVGNVPADRSNYHFVKLMEGRNDLTSPSSPSSALKKPQARL